MGFFRSDFLWREEILYPKTVFKNLLWTYKKLHNKGKKYVSKVVSEILCSRQKSLLLIGLAVSHLATRDFATGGIGSPPPIFFWKGEFITLDAKIL